MQRRKITLDIPPLESIPDLGVNPAAAALIRVCVWLTQAEREIKAAINRPGFNVEGTSASGYEDALGKLAYDFWIAALDHVQGFGAIRDQKNKELAEEVAP